MKVILLHKVPGLGNTDDVKEVADGYARNFLFPRHLAVPASQRTEEYIAARHKREAKAAERELREQQDVASKIDGREVEMAERANDSGVLYAAVSPAKIAAALEKLGFMVKTEQIVGKPIKNVGAHEVKIKFAHGLEAAITVNVIAAKGK